MFRLEGLNDWESPTPGNIEEELTNLTQTKAEFVILKKDEEQVSLIQAMLGRGLKKLYLEVQLGSGERYQAKKRTNHGGS